MSSRRGLVPAETSSLIGRESELHAVQLLLSEARLVTLTGAGGIGKTRIALRAAAECRGEFPDGSYFADLSALSDPRLLPRAIAEVFGLSGQSSVDPLNLLISHVGTRRLLLIMDTCEHVVDACAMFAEALLQAAPHVTIVATSRRPLDAFGEHTMQVPPLSADGEHSAAVRLFTDRAAAVQHGRRFDDAARGQVLAICRLLDGIPLAIELAAARLRALSLEQLRTRLSDRFKILTTGHRTALPRHRTLDAAIGWSYELCSRKERLMWDRVSVFVGSFDLAAAQEACCGDELAAHEAADLLYALIEKSVLLRVDTAAGDGERYRLLDTLREFGVNRLRTSGGWSALCRRHQEYFQKAAESFFTHCISEHQEGLYRRALEDNDNHRAALDRALEQVDGDPLDAADFAYHLWPYWLCSGQVSEGRHWLRRAGEALERMCSAEAERAVQVRLLRLRAVQGFMATLQGDFTAALELLVPLDQGALPGQAALGVECSVLVGCSLVYLGPREQARERLTAARTALGGDGNQLLLGLVDIHESLLASLCGSPEAAIARADAGLERLADMPGEWSITSHLHLCRGHALLQRGEPARSAEAVCAGLGLLPDTRDTTHVAYSMELLAWASWHLGRCEEAGRLVGAAEHAWSLAEGRTQEDAGAMHDLSELVVQLRRAQGDEKFETQYEQGREYSVTEAVQRVLTASPGPASTAP
ncbi:hypothetical protein WDA79_05895 [Streptomyces sp. A475]|uniref:ATP-binding protein n=1 Tax=Streptomyces sp. A475 TaxID=3131976 RepID=UPI0030C9815E